VRIVSGRFGGRRLPARIAEGTRPTSDRVREAIGSALAARSAFDGAHVLDLFAGSGALGLEALSRGARRLVSVDDDRRVVLGIEQNVRALGAGDDALVVALDLLGTPARAAARLAQLPESPFSLVFADPPYADAARLPELITALLDAGALAGHAFVVLEHADAHVVPALAGFEQVARYRYGDSAVTLLARVS
jgi:16S rRNA (guanine966-N2)-methyltransferase